MESWRKREIIALRPNYRPPATIQGKPLKLVGAQKDYILSNCVGCGECCRAIAMSPEFQDAIVDMPPGWRPITEKEAYKINPWMKGFFKQPKVWFTCEDLKNGFCTVYENREPICQNYPLIDSTPGARLSDAWKGAVPHCFHLLPETWEGAVPWCYYYRLKMQSSLNSPNTIEDGCIKKISITIGTPHLRNFTPEYVSSLAKTLQDARYDYIYLPQEGNTVHQQRNLLARQTTSDLLLIDTDICWTPADIQKLIELDKDIAIGFCLSQTIPPQPVLACKSEGFQFCPTLEKIPSEPFKVVCCGTGFMLIKKKVLDRFFELQVWPFDPFPIDIVSNNISWNDLPTRFFNEGESFCFKALSLGFEIWCHPQARIGHVGVFTF
jgi:hypothetical protein